MTAERALTALDKAVDELVDAAALACYGADERPTEETKGFIDAVVGFAFAVRQWIRLTAAPVAPSEDDE